jgi:hypothetical protein
MGMKARVAGKGKWVDWEATRDRVILADVATRLLGPAPAAAAQRPIEPEAPAAADIANPEVVAAIDRAPFGPAPPCRPERGPRDYRLGDRWLPWHSPEGWGGRCT